jgi:hypothetical protein
VRQLDADYSIGNTVPYTAAALAAVPGRSQCHQVAFGARANCGLQVACWHQVDRDRHRGCAKDCSTCSRSWLLSWVAPAWPGTSSRSRR